MSALQDIKPVDQAKVILGKQVRQKCLSTT